MGTLFFLFVVCSCCSLIFFAGKARNSYMRHPRVPFSLPIQHRFSKWVRLFSLLRDGASFSTLLYKCKSHERTVLVIETDRGERFGGYAADIWQRADGFYGKGESFLFKVIGESRGDGNSIEVSVVSCGQAGRLLLLLLSFFTCARQLSKARTNPILQVYKWTGANSFHQLCDSKASRIAMGGGGPVGQFGICIEDDFQRGTSGPNETYGNKEPLVNGGGYFDVINLEVYGFEY